MAIIKGNIQCGNYEITIFSTEPKASFVAQSLTLPRPNSNIYFLSMPEFKV